MANSKPWDRIKARLSAATIAEIGRRPAMEDSLRAVADCAYHMGRTDVYQEVADRLETLTKNL